MCVEQNYSADWVSSPGETILQVLNRRDIALNDFAKNLGLNKTAANELLRGDMPISESLASLIEKATGISQSFLIKRESKYRENLKSLKSERLSWLERLPINDLVSGGYIPKFLSKEKKVDACLRFFGVSNIAEWDDAYSRKLGIVSFRTSNSFDTVPESVISWLRMAEISVSGKESETWNPEKLKYSLPDIRKLTNESSPKIFLPQLEKLLAACGVSLAIVKTPQGTRASGATYFLTPEKAILILSFRHKTNDHFWFSLFHEIGHLLLHGNRALFIEDRNLSNSTEEEEADLFAETTLVPTEYKSEMLNFGHKDIRKIMKFAKKIGIAPGIVVGQLQHNGKIPHGYLNKMKVRYGSEAFSSL